MRKLQHSGVDRTTVCINLTQGGQACASVALVGILQVLWSP